MKEISAKVSSTWDAKVINFAKALGKVGQADWWLAKLSIIAGESSSTAFLAISELTNRGLTPGLGIRSHHSLLKEQRERIALIALYKKSDKEGIALFTYSNTRAIRFLWKSDWLFSRIGFAPFWRENGKLDLQIYITLFGFSFIKRKREPIALFKKAMRAKRSCRSLKKERREWFALVGNKKESKKSDSLLRAKERFALL